MKKQSLLFLLIIFALISNAQIILEETFPAYISTTNTHFKTVYFTSSSFEDNHIDFYNEDYSLYKTVSIDPPYGYYCNFISNVSDHLFNDDDLLEFTCVFIDTLNYSGFLFKLYDENGNVLMDFGNAFGAWPHKTINDETRFVVIRYLNYPNTEYETDIYSLPGTITTSKSHSSEINESYPFPNPTNNFINLSYRLDQSEIVDLQIFNSNGQIVETKKIGGAFDRIMLDVSDYKPGNYFYKYKTTSQTFIVY